MKKNFYNTKKSIKTLAAASAAVVSIGAASAAFGDAVTVVSWGGSYGKAQDAALFTDASRNSGIAINRESGASMSKVMLQVESGAVTWDLVVSGSGSCASAAAAGALEKIDFDVEDVCLRKTALPISRYPSFRIFMWEAVGISSALRPNARANACFAMIRSFTVRKR